MISITFVDPNDIKAWVNGVPIMKRKYKDRTRAVTHIDLIDNTKSFSNGKG